MYTTILKKLCIIKIDVAIHSEMLILLRYASSSPAIIAYIFDESAILIISIYIEIGGRYRYEHSTNY